MELDLKPNNFEMVDGMVGNWFVDFKRDHKVLLTDEKSVYGKCCASHTSWKGILRTFFPI